MKFIKFLSVLLLASTGLFAMGSVKALSLLNVSSYSTSGGNTITCNMSAVTGSRIVIYGIKANSDLGGSVLKLQEAAAAGVTTNYNTISIDLVGTGNFSLYPPEQPIFIGKSKYAYRVLLNSTSAGSATVLYRYE